MEESAGLRPSVAEEELKGRRRRDRRDGMLEAAMGF